MVAAGKTFCEDPVLLFYSKLHNIFCSMYFGLSNELNKRREKWPPKNLTKDVKSGPR